MSERVTLRGKDISIEINGKKCTGKYGQTILDIARANNIYIPTMCYLTKIKPIASCRMCVVNVEGQDGFVLSCQEKAIDGAVVTTNSDELFGYRQNIMKLYNVNHPLQCGVCDKSGECDLQNKTLEFEVSEQSFAAQEHFRKKKKWGVLGYDPYLCIMCERCVHTCNEIVGSEALYIKPGGYKSEIDIHMGKCIQCGECISVCPVGALVSNGYKYISNSWESNQIPSSCAHCSSACALSYDVKHSGINKFGEQKIARVKNEFEFGALCGGGRFGFDFENKNTKGGLGEASKALSEAKNIVFNSFITNEEAMLLQKLKEQFGFNLVNEDALNFKNFLNAYSSIVGTSLYSANLEDVVKSDFVICIGTKITNDNPMVKFKINEASKKNKADVVYMHPMVDESLKHIYTQFVKYEVGTEEGVIALLASEFAKNSGYFNDFDVGYLSAESNFGEEELDEIIKKAKRKHNKVLIVGADLYAHPRATNIAKIIGIIEKYGNFKVLIIPSQTNTLGVSLICDISGKEHGTTIGYNMHGDFIIGSNGEVDFNIPALNQQEGTFVNIDKKVVAINAALNFDGYCLNDIVNFVTPNKDLKTKYTIEHTHKLPIENGFKAISFDAIKIGYDNIGNDLSGYELDVKCVPINEGIDEIASLPAFDGTIIYAVDPISQFNSWTAKASLLNNKPGLYGSESFAKIAKIHSGDEVLIKTDGKEFRKIFKTDMHLQGTIAVCNTFDEALSPDLITSGYRFKQAKIEKVYNE